MWPLWNPERSWMRGRKWGEVDKTMGTVFIFCLMIPTLYTCGLVGTYLASLRFDFSSLNNLMLTCRNIPIIKTTKGFEFRAAVEPIEPREFHEPKISAESLSLIFLVFPPLFKIVKQKNGITERYHFWMAWVLSSALIVCISDWFLSTIHAQQALSYFQEISTKRFGEWRYCSILPHHIAY